MTRINSFFKDTIKTIGNFGHHIVKTIAPHVSYGLHQFAGIAPQLGNIISQVAGNYGHPKFASGAQKGIGLAGQIANSIGTGLHYLTNKNMAMNNYGGGIHHHGGAGFGGT